MRFELDFTYQAGASPNKFCLHMTLSWQAKFTGVYGPSGSGKSTLLDVLLGLKDPASLRGTVRVGERSLFDRSTETWLPRQHRNMSWVPQDSLLLPHLTVADNLAIVGGGDTAISECVSELGLGALMTKKPWQLSGGEKQIVALARAILRSGELMLLDEPFAALDAMRRKELLALLQNHSMTRDINAIYVSHRADEIKQLCDYVIVLEAGVVKWHGPQDSWQPYTEADNL
ncbi:MAG: ATP-binding cassette domain-containing protein [Deltaproteobacteria bacterium]|nr:ATP-binding cassette domain-containing protein [Deltaproteobacteria bacterium]